MTTTAIPPLPASPHEIRLARAREALEGLSVGDAFGECFFVRIGLTEMIEQRGLRSAPWRWTDDTAMAISVFEELTHHREIDPDRIALRYAQRYIDDRARGYGGGAHSVLGEIFDGRPWQRASTALFEGQGSMGNGGAMRSAPIGAYFSEDLALVVDHARRSALPTHAHADGQAGAIAIAVATAIAQRMRLGALPRDPRSLIEITLAHTPEGATHDMISYALSLPLDYDVRTAVSALGNGSEVISSDTVPLVLWCAARHLDSYEEALWTTVSALGDRDTTCAMVGAILAVANGVETIPIVWRESREPLPI